MSGKPFYKQYILFANTVNIAEWTSLSGFLEVALRVSAHSGRCRSRLIESKVYCWLCVLK